MNLETADALRLIRFLRNFASHYEPNWIWKLLNQRCYICVCLLSQTLEIMTVPFNRGGLPTASL